MVLKHYISHNHYIYIFFIYFPDIYNNYKFYVTYLLGQLNVRYMLCYIAMICRYCHWHSGSPCYCDCYHLRCHLCLHVQRQLEMLAAIRS